MQKTAQYSQSKSDSPRRPRIYAIAKKSADIAHVHVAFWADGGPKNFMVGFSRRGIAAEIAGIENALADGSETFDPGNGQIYEISPELLGELRSILSSYHAVLQGGSDAQVVRGGVSTSAKPKASARADGGNAPEASSPSEVAGSVGRQFNEERRIKNEELAGEVARIVGDELRKAVMPLLAEIDAIAALLKECALEVAASKPARKRNAGKSSTGRETPISIKRGRTSVVVGSRKAS